MNQSDFNKYLLESRVDLNKEIGPAPVAISAGGYKDFSGNYHYIPMLTYGNFMFVQAPPKNAKTFFTTLLIAAYMGGNTGLLKGHGSEGKRVLHVDTEQSKFHAQGVFRRIPQMCKNMLPYETLALRGLDPEKRLEFLATYLEEDKDNTVGLVVIDGIADLLYDNNDIVEANKVVTFLMRITAIHDIALVTVIHTNPGTEKPTGHIGSFLEKKAETQVHLTKEDRSDYVQVRCKYSRNHPFDDFGFTIVNGLPIIFENDVPF